MYTPGRVTWANCVVDKEKSAKFFFLPIIDFNRIEDGTDWGWSKILVSAKSISDLDNITIHALPSS